MTGKKGKAKRTWPIDVDCPKCIAKVGWGCVTLEGTWRLKFHKERSDKAKAVTEADQDG